LLMISQSDQERERYEARLKMQRDIYTALAEARREGEAKGRTEREAKGRTESEAKGEAKGRVEMQIIRIQNLQSAIRQHMIAQDQLRALPLTDLESLAGDLERQLDARLARGG